MKPGDKGGHKLWVIHCLFKEHRIHDSARIHTHTLHLNAMWRNCLDALGFLNTNIWYVGSICLCLMWTTSDPSKCKSSYFNFVQYSPCHSESFNGFLCKVILLGVVDSGYFLQDFLWLFFCMAQRYVICNSTVDGHSLFNRKHCWHTLACCMWDNTTRQASYILTQTKWANLPSITKFFHSCTQQTKWSYTQ